MGTLALCSVPIESDGPALGSFVESEGSHGNAFGAKVANEVANSDLSALPHGPQMVLILRNGNGIALA